MTKDQTIDSTSVQTGESIYQFPNGLPGFEEFKTFRLEEHNEAFSLLSASEQPEVSFITVDPFQFRPEFEFRLTDDVIQLLRIENRNQVAVRCIVTWHSDRKRITVNFLAPIVLNLENHLGKQVVLHDTAYTTRDLLWTNSEESGES